MTWNLEISVPYDFIPPPPPGQIAQSVEQRTENPCVGGSIPPLATSKFNVQLKILLLLLDFVSIWASILPDGKSL